MFAHDLCHSQVEYLRNSTRREPPFESLRVYRQGLTTGSNDRVERSILIEKTERSDTTNLQSSIVNIQFRLVRVGLKDVPVKANIK